MTGIVHPDAPCEDRIEYSLLNLCAIMLCAWWTGVTGCVAGSLLSSHDWPSGIFVCALSLLGVAGLLYSAFGKSVLRLSQEGGIYSAGLWKLRRQVKFVISRETDAYVDEYPNPELINQGVPIREIAVMSGKVRECGFARSLPKDVQEFFCRCIARRAAGVPLKDMDSGRRVSGIGHPVALTVILVAVAACFVYAFSAQEHLFVEDGMLVIEETEWYGHESSVSKIPFKDITYINLKSHGRGSWHLDILGKDRRIIRRLHNYGREVSGYQIGLMQAIKCRPGTPFDRSRYTHLFFIALGFFLLIPAAFACGGFETAPKIGRAPPAIF